MASLPAAAAVPPAEVAASPALVEQERATSAGSLDGRNQEGPDHDGPFQATYQEIVDNAVAATDARLVVLCRYDSSTGIVRVAAWAAPRSAAVARGLAAVRRFVPGFDPGRVSVRADVNPLAQVTYLEGRPVCAPFHEVAGGAIDPRILRAAAEIAGLRHACLYPLRASRLAGATSGAGRGTAGSLGFYAPRPLAPAQRRTAEAFARQAALTLENAALLAAERLARRAADAAAHRLAAQTERLARREAEAAALREVNRLKDEFLQTVSHELRTPLTLIYGYGELLEARLGALGAANAGPPPLAALALLRTMAERLASGARQLAGLVDDLLDLGPIERGEFALCPTTLDLAPVLREVLASFRAHPGGDRLADEIASPLPAWADRARVLQMASNLVANALKYAPAGPIVLRARRDGESVVGGPWVRVEVEDCGPGVPLAEQLRVWEKFYRGAGVAGGGGPAGSGVGLAVVKALAEAHGGHAGLDLPPGRGACFWFALPVAVEDPAPDEEPISDSDAGVVGSRLDEDAVGAE